MCRECMRASDSRIRIIKMATCPGSPEILVIQPHLDTAKIGIIGIKPPDPYLVCIRDISADCNATWRVELVSLCYTNEGDE